MFARCCALSRGTRRRRRILDPGMIRAGVIRYLVLDHFDPSGVRPSTSSRNSSSVAEVFLDAVEIDGAIAMIIGDRLVRRTSPAH